MRDLSTLDPLEAGQEVTTQFLGEAVKKVMPDFLYSPMGWRKYKDGVWRSADENEILSAIISVCNHYNRNFTTNLANNVVLFLRTILHKDEWNINPNVIALKNGFIDLTDGELRPHSKNLFITEGMDFEYDKDAQCPAWERLISLFDEDTRYFVQQFVGYSLTNRTELHTSLWLVGPPGGGKSTFIKGIQNVLGSMSGTLSLKKMTENRFGLSGIVGKRLLVATEQPSGFVARTDLFNSIVTGDSVLVEQKGKDHFEYDPVAKIMWAMNDVPAIASTEDGIYRRIKIVRMNKIKEKDPSVELRIMQEKQGILNWMITGLKNLNEDGGFSIPQKITEEVQNYKLGNNHIEQFLRDHFETTDDPKDRISSSELYALYKVHADDYLDHGSTKYSLTRFGIELKNFYKVKKTKKANMVTHIKKKV